MSEAKVEDDDDASDAELENRASALFASLRLAGVPFKGDGWDDYDNSVKLYGVPSGFRLSEEQQRLVYDAGYSVAYVNHVDDWETHYRYDRREPFRAKTGWRVSYPHERGGNQKGIWVEDDVEGWPRQWFETGYVLIKKALSP